MIVHWLLVLIAVVPLVTLGIPDKRYNKHPRLNKRANNQSGRSDDSKIMSNDIINDSWNDHFLETIDILFSTLNAKKTPDTKEIMPVEERSLNSEINAIDQPKIGKQLYNKQNFDNTVAVSKVNANSTLDSNSTNLEELYSRTLNDTVAINKVIVSSILEPNSTYLEELDSRTLNDTVAINKVNVSSILEPNSTYLEELDSRTLNNTVAINKVNMSSILETNSIYLEELDSRTLNDTVAINKVNVSSILEPNSTYLEELDSRTLKDTVAINKVNVSSILDLNLTNLEELDSSTLYGTRTVNKVNFTSILEPNSTYLEVLDTRTLDDTVAANEVNVSSILDLNSTNLEELDTRTLDDRVAANKVNMSSLLDSDIKNLEEPDSNTLAVNKVNGSSMLDLDSTNLEELDSRTLSDTAPVNQVNVSILLDSNLKNLEELYNRTLNDTVALNKVNVSSILHLDSTDLEKLESRTLNDTVAVNKVNVSSILVLNSTNLEERDNRTLNDKVADNRVNVSSILDLNSTNIEELDSLILDGTMTVRKVNVSSMLDSNSTSPEEKDNVTFNQLSVEKVNVSLKLHSNTISPDGLKSRDLDGDQVTVDQVNLLDGNISILERLDNKTLEKKLRAVKVVTSSELVASMTISKNIEDRTVDDPLTISKVNPSSKLMNVQNRGEISSQKSVELQENTNQVENLKKMMEEKKKLSKPESFLEISVEEQTLSIKPTPPLRVSDSMLLIRVIPTSNIQLDLLKHLLKKKRRPFQMQFWRHPDALYRHVYIWISKFNYKKHILKRFKKFGIKVKFIRKNFNKGILRPQYSMKNIENYDKVYHDLDELSSEIVRLTALYDDLLSIDVIGRSGQGREIYVVHIRKDRDVVKPIIIILCGLHSREWLAVASCQYVLRKLVFDHNYDEDIKKMLKYYDVEIVPMSNPDGYVHTFNKKRLWRKTRSVNGHTWCRGVDLNRNFNYKWGSGGSSPDPCNDVYCGEKPFSEKESLALAKYIYHIRKKLAAFLDVHTFSQMWMSPWGHTSELPRHHKTQKTVLKKIQKAILARTGEYYRIGPSFSTLYQTSGTARDWVYGLFGLIHTYDVELRPKFGTRYNQFTRPTKDIEPTGIELLTGLKTMSNHLIDELINRSHSNLVMNSDKKFENDMQIQLNRYYDKVPNSV